MKVKLNYCDICKNRLFGSDGDVRIKYRAKRKWINWYDFGWERIDICSKCLNKIISAKAESEDKE